MELKFTFAVRNIESLLCSNRTFMELKLKCPFGATSLQAVLIVPLWN